MNEREAKLMLQHLKTYQKQATSSREEALKALMRAGLVTKSGQPTKRYAPLWRHTSTNSRNSP